MFTNPSAERIRSLLREVRSIAVVGLSPDPQRPSHRVAKALQGCGYRILPVRPGLAEVLGEKAYAHLADVPAPVDVVEVFRRGEAVSAIVDECILLGIRRLWLQDGVIDETAAARAVAAGIEVVMDRCMWRDYLELMT
jgi:predicted CoA-binding protein